MEKLRYIRGKKPSTLTTQNRKIIKKEDVCAICGRTFEKKDLEVEHTIPVCIGGNPMEFRIACDGCHSEKTIRDLNFIHYLRKVGLLIKVSEYEYLIFNKKKAIEWYLELNEACDRYDRFADKSH